MRSVYKDRLIGNMSSFFIFFSIGEGHEGGDTVDNVTVPQQAALKWQTSDQMAVKASHAMKIFP